jgi:hypothetical protein
MVKTDQQVLDLAKLGRDDPAEFMVRALDVKRPFLWGKMREIADSMRDNERTTVGAGHGVSKTYTLGRLALTFLATHCPSTVVTTAPTGTQVKDLLWREIRDCHANAKLPIGGKLTTTMLDMQHDTGRKWFATGFSTKPDTVTKEATAFQGYHNESLLIIFDEAAGILPEIWRAAEHIGAPHKRFVSIGNPTAGVGEFAESLSDPTYNYINIAVTDTPNYKEGKIVIPGLYGRQYVDRIKTKYGEDSDEFRVRVMGLKSKKAVKGSYYGEKIDQLRKRDRIGSIQHNPHYPVYVVCDFGYTSAFWFFQEIGTNVHVLDYYEDSGVGLEDYARLFLSWEDKVKILRPGLDYGSSKGYNYAKVIVPCDMDSNGTRIITGQTALTEFRSFGFNAKPLKKEHRVAEGIDRTRRFLDRCVFSADCEFGLGRMVGYHEKINKAMSTDDNPVYIGTPDKDGNDHGADAFRYMSMAFETGMVVTDKDITSQKQYQELKRQYA